MADKTHKIRAIGLFSGGLDSILAALVLKRAGIEVECISFETPFFSASKAQEAFGATSIPVHVRNITEPYLKMIRSPRFGYGKHMNPCLDCHALMLKIAGQVMAEMGFDFIFTGEVVGQRPMSQTKPSLRCTEKAAGLVGYVLRPLSANLLPVTIPEDKGWVNRDDLLFLSGRSRKPQIALAKEYGISEYPAPAGGCLLTDATFSRRLKDLFLHQQEYLVRDFELLKTGRHFRLTEKHKIVVGRTQQDNHKIEELLFQKDGFEKGDVILKVSGFPGPVGLIPRGADKEIIYKGAAICAAYSKADKDTKTNITVRTNGRTESVTVISHPPERYRQQMI